MATTETSGFVHAREQHAGFTLGGAAGEAVCGVGTVVLAILGLANEEWTLMAPIATILAGVALVFAGTSIASRLAAAATTTSEIEEGGSMTVEIVGGLAGVVLGILAVLNIVPNILISAAVIAFGGSLMLGSIATSQINSIARRRAASETGETIGREAVYAASGSQVLVGLAAIVLGIIALVGQPDYRTPLNLVALLVVGGGVVLTGSTVTGRLIQVLRH